MTHPAEILKQIKSLPDHIQKSFERLGLVGNIAKHTLKELLQVLYETKSQLKPKTLERYNDAAKVLLSFISANEGIEMIEKTDCERFVNILLKKYALSTSTRLVRHFKMVFRFAIDLGWIEKNPFEIKVKRCDVNHKRQKYIDKETIYKVMSYCQDDRYRLLLALARFGGLRIPSEINMLRYQDFTEHVIRIHENTKTGAREVPFFREIREIFCRLEKEHSASELVFINLGDFRSRVFSAIRASGVERWEKLFLNLRSSCITDCVELGYSEKMLDSMFGNSSVIRSHHYIQFRKEREYAKALAENERLYKMASENIEKELLTEGELTDLLVLRDLLVDRFGIGKKAG